MDDSKHKNIVLIIGAVAILLIWLFLSGNKTAAEIVNKVGNAIGLPNVAGFDVNTGDSTYNIPALKIRNGCGQRACSFNIIPQKLGGLGLANPSASLMRDIAGRETVASMVRNENMIMVTNAPPFYPFSATRMIGG